MESTILVDIDGDSRLMFATNSSGVVLISQFGNISYSSEEFQYYQCLFKMTDTENIGKLCIGSQSLSSLLWRTSLEYETIHKLLSLSVNSISPKARCRTITVAAVECAAHDDIEKSVDENENGIDDEQKDDWVADLHDDITITDDDKLIDESKSSDAYLSLHQWLLLCKMILHLQLNPQAVADVTLLEIICSMYEYENLNARKEDILPLPTIRTPSPSSTDVHCNNTCVEGNRDQIEINCSTADGDNDTTGPSNCNINGKDLHNLHDVSCNKSFANFRLGVPVTAEDSLLSATVTGWEICSEGFQKNHTKFTISFTYRSGISTYGNNSSNDIIYDSCSSSALPTNSSSKYHTEKDSMLLNENATGYDTMKDNNKPQSHNTISIESKSCSLQENSKNSSELIDTKEGSAVLVSSKVNVEASGASVPTATTAVIPPKKVMPTGKKTKKNKGGKAISVPIVNPTPTRTPVIVNIAPANPPSFSSSLYSSSSSSSSSSSTSPSPFTPLYSPISPLLPSPVTPISEVSVNSRDVSNGDRVDPRSLELNMTSQSPISGNKEDGQRGFEKNILCGEKLDSNDNEMLKASMKGIYSNDKEILDSGLESQRRYSDFEVLVSVLQKLYKGVILPPLPPKTWTSQLQQQTQPSQLFAVQRLSELQLFITSLLSHPIIKNSYELRVFLAASKVGLNSFRLSLPLFSFNSMGWVIPNNSPKGIVRSSSEFISGWYPYPHILLFFICRIV